MWTTHFASPLWSNMIQRNLQKCCHQCSLVFHCLLSQVLVWWLYFPSCTKKQYRPSSCKVHSSLSSEKQNKKQTQPQLTVLFDFRALRTNSMNKVFADFSDVLRAIHCSQSTKPPYPAFSVVFDLYSQFGFDHCREMLLPQFPLPSLIIIASMVVEEKRLPITRWQ